MVVNLVKLSQMQTNLEQHLTSKLSISVTHWHKNTLNVHSLQIFVHCFLNNPLFLSFKYFPNSRQIERAVEFSQLYAKCTEDVFKYPDAHGLCTFLLFFFLCWALAVHTDPLWSDLPRDWRSTAKNRILAVKHRFLFPVSTHAIHRLYHSLQRFRSPCIYVFTSVEYRPTQIFTALDSPINLKVSSAEFMAINR